jgi:hypothetical protein
MDKNIVFDFDQTIGYFEQIIEIIKYTKKTSKLDVFELFILFPLVFRTNIFDIFNYIVRLKKERKIKSVILYSSNNNDTFIEYVLSFIHQKLNYTLFDTSISLNQTHTKNKNITDLLKYSNGLLTKKSSIFFIDDKEHDQMKCIKYYIKCESYKYIYSNNTIQETLKINQNNDNENITNITNITKINEKNKIIQSVYSAISKEIISKIRLFVMMNL